MFACAAEEDETIALSGKWKIVRYEVANTRSVVLIAEQGVVSFTDGKMTVKWTDRRGRVNKSVYTYTVGRKGEQNEISLTELDSLESFPGLDKPITLGGLVRRTMGQLELAFGSQTPTNFERRPLSDRPKETVRIHYLDLVKDDAPQR